MVDEQEMQSTLLVVVCENERSCGERETWI